MITALPEWRAFLDAQRGGIGVLREAAGKLLAAAEAYPGADIVPAYNHVMAAHIRRDETDEAEHVLDRGLARTSSRHWYWYASTCSTDGRLAQRSLQVALRSWSARPRVSGRVFRSRVASSIRRAPDPQLRRLTDAVGVLVHVPVGAEIIDAVLGACAPWALRLRGVLSTTADWRENADASHPKTSRATAKLRGGRAATIDEIEAVGEGVSAGVVLLGVARRMHLPRDQYRSYERSVDGFLRVSQLSCGSLGHLEASLRKASLIAEAVQVKELRNRLTSCGQRSGLLDAERTR
mgnify:CR=1 FL=1